MENIEKLSREKCTGCLLCKAICPKQCINIELDAMGFRYPKIDNNKCVNCGVCVKNCPELSPVNKCIPKDTYAMLWNNHASLNGCSSGGVASALATHIVDEGGVYYGAVSEKNGNVVYHRISTSGEIQLAKGSKYIQSNMEEVYAHIRNDLIRKLKVIFVGTPCQSAAVMKYCKDHLSNLYIVSFPCGGWSSSRVIQSEVYRISRINQFQKVVMRNRRKVSIDIYNNDVLIASCKPNDSYFMTALDYKYCVRKSCWMCSYSIPERIGDIIIGDFWGYKSDGVFNEREIREGISFCSYLTDKGKNLLESILPEMKSANTNYSKVREDNPRLNNQVIQDKHFDYSRRLLFESIYNGNNIKESVLKTDLKNHLIRKLRGIIKYRILRREG